MRRFQNRFPGPLGDALDEIGELAEAARVVNSPHIRVKQASNRGQELELVNPPQGGRGAAAAAITTATVIHVHRDTLECSNDFGVTTFEVQKPPHLKIEHYAPYDAAVLANFSDNILPLSPIDWNEYTNDYVMRRSEDATVAEGVQQRYRLVYANFLNPVVDWTNPPNGRLPIIELVWPPYHGLPGGFGLPPNSDPAWLGADRDQIAVIEIDGVKTDLNIHNRRWVDLQERKGERLIRVDVTGGPATYFGRLIDSGILEP